MLHKTSFNHLEKPMVHLVVIDTKAGNFGSVLNALSRVGATVDITQDRQAIEKAKALVLPGVAAFKRGMNGLNEAGLTDIIKHQAAVSKVPTIGICLGMQLLAETGTENAVNEEPIKGLGLIAGHVSKLKPTHPDYRVPNIGWYDVTATKNSVLFPAGYKAESFYHVHSYHMQCTNPCDVAAQINYSDALVTVAVEKDNIFGVQFHPEKSQDAGLDLLERFVQSVRHA